MQNGEVIDGPTKSLDYVDDRFPWQVKQEALFRVHWYQGDLTFAQKALDAAQSGLERIRSILPVQNPLQSISIFTQIQQTCSKRSNSPAKPGSQGMPILI